MNRASDSTVNQNAIIAPMPGAIRAVFVGQGDRVREGDKLIVLEAMKMEHTLTAPRDGVIADVFAALGDQVEVGACLVQLAGDD